MREKKFILVAYDISDDKRRTRLHDRLLDFGTPVQYSVFECLLEGDQMAKMKRAVKKIARSKSDHVRFYPICESCHGKIEVLGRTEVVHKTDVLVV